MDVLEGGPTNAQVHILRFKCARARTRDDAKAPTAPPRGGGGRRRVRTDRERPGEPVVSASPRVSVVTQGRKGNRYARAVGKP